MVLWGIWIMAITVAIYETRFFAKDARAAVWASVVGPLAFTRESPQADIHVLEGRRLIYLIAVFTRFVIIPISEDAAMRKRDSTLNAEASSEGLAAYQASRVHRARTCLRQSTDSLWLM